MLGTCSLSTWLGNIILLTVICVGRGLYVCWEKLGRKVSGTPWCFLILEQQWTWMTPQKTCVSCSLKALWHQWITFFVLVKGGYNLAFLKKICFHLLRSVHLCRTVETWQEKSRVVWALLNYYSDQILISPRCRRKCYFYYPLPCTCLHIYPGVRDVLLIIFVGNQDSSFDFWIQSCQPV